MKFTIQLEKFTIQLEIKNLEVKRKPYSDMTVYKQTFRHRDNMKRVFTLLLKTTFLVCSIMTPCIPHCARCYPKVWEIWILTVFGMTCCH